MPTKVVPRWQKEVSKLVVGRPSAMRERARREADERKAKCEELQRKLAAKEAGQLVATKAGAGHRGMLGRAEFYY